MYTYAWECFLVDLSTGLNSEGNYLIILLLCLMVIGLMIYHVVWWTSVQSRVSSSRFNATLTRINGYWRGLNEWFYDLNGLVIYFHMKTKHCLLNSKYSTCIKLFRNLLSCFCRYWGNAIMAALWDMPMMQNHTKDL